MDYDIIVIGGGPGGYVAAIRAAQLGFKVACIDKWLNQDNKPSLGGTCLNVGCIPSKALLESSHLLAEIEHSKELGINAKVSMDIKKMIAHKDKITTELTSGIAYLFKQNKVTWLQGEAKIVKSKQVLWTDHNNKEQTITSQNIVIATGSKPIIPSNMKLVKDKVLDSTGALNLKKVPNKLCIIGSGAIGLELGSVWSRLGSKVTILEKEDFLLSADSKISKSAKAIFKKQGILLKTKHELVSIDSQKASIVVNYKNQNNELKDETFDKVIIAVGRAPYSENLIANNDTGINLDKKGYIEVDEFCQTSASGIYAIGDVTRGPMLAHKASEEGVMVIERIAGQKTQIDHNLVAMVIYTEPEIAWVGATEQQLKEKGVAYKAGEFPFAASGRAKSANKTDGFVKIISDKNTDRILGAHIIGSKASELIAQIVIAMQFEGSTEDIIRTIFAHPTLSEAVHEAALAVDKIAIHSINKK